jgi:ferritin
MINPNKLEANVVKLLLPRLEDEFDAAYQYRAGENWAKGEGFDRAAEYFAKESADELVHAKKIEKYLVDWNVIPNLPKIDPPKLVFTSLVDAVGFFYQMEYDLFEAYKKTGNEMREIDLSTFALMQEFIEIQRKSVAEWSDKLNILKDVSGTKFELLMLEKKLF